MENMPKLVAQKFYCFKCNKAVVSLYYHLKQDHNITVDKYLEWIYICFDQQVKRNNNDY